MEISFAIGAGLIVLGYLLGSFPTGYLVGRLLKGIDIREHGSGSTGATNVLRTVGKGPAIAVFLMDILKGTTPVWIAKNLQLWVTSQQFPTQWQPWLVLLVAFAALLGHSRSVWLKFTGGKSVATGLGVLLAMSPWLAIGSFGSFLMMLALFRIVSLGSIVASIMASVVAIALQLPLPYLIFTAIGGIYVIFRHRANIQRLLAGTEPQIGQKLQEEND